MTISVNLLRQEASALMEEAQEITLGDVYGGEERAKVDKMLEDARLKRERADLLETIERDKKVEMITPELEEVTPGITSRNQALKDYLREGVLPDAHRSADGGFSLREVPPAGSGTTLAPVTSGSTQVSTVGEAVDVVQHTTTPNVVVAMRRFNSVYSVAEVYRTADGNNYRVPTMDDTDNKAVILGEGQPTTGQGVAFGSVVLTAYKYSTKAVAVSLEMLQDAVFNVESYVERALTERVGRATAEHFTKGTGTNEPRGIVLDSQRLAETIGATTPITYDMIVDLTMSVDPAYRGMGMASFMCNSATLGTLMKIKDGDGRPIFQITPGYTGTISEPLGRILGWPVVVNDEMDSQATSGAVFLLFGDLSAYKVREVMGLELHRLQELYLPNGMYGFLGFARYDGRAVIGSTTNRRVWNLSRG